LEEPCANFSIGRLPVLQPLLPTARLVRRCKFTVGA